MRKAYYLERADFSVSNEIFEKITQIFSKVSSDSFDVTDWEIVIENEWLVIKTVNILRRLDLLTLQRIFRQTLLNTLKENILNETSEEKRIGSLLFLTVQQIDGKSIYFSNPGCAAILQMSEYKDEKFFVGKEYAVIVKEVSLSSNYKSLMYLTRRGPGLLQELINFYIPSWKEAFDIMHICRFENVVSYIFYKNKINNKNENNPPIGYNKIKSIIAHLQGEKIVWVIYPEDDSMENIAKNYLNTISAGQYEYELSLNEDLITIKTDNPGYFIGKGGVHSAVLSQVTKCKILITRLTTEEE